MHAGGAWTGNNKELINVDLSYTVARVSLIKDHGLNTVHINRSYKLKTNEKAIFSKSWLEDRI